MSPRRLKRSEASTGEGVHYVLGVTGRGAEINDTDRDAWGPADTGTRSDGAGGRSVSRDDFRVWRYIQSMADVPTNQCDPLEHDKGTSCRKVAESFRVTSLHGDPRAHQQSET